MSELILNKNEYAIAQLTNTLRKPRTKLADRILPGYTKGEELFNMISHIVGAVLGLVALVLCVARSGFHNDLAGVLSGALYGLSLITLYTISSVYHGLGINLAKKVMQVIDHCTIYFLICGTYTPILMCGLRPYHPIWAFTILGIVCGLSIFATVFTAIDHNKYSKLSMICYIAIGWCIVIAIKPTVETVSLIALLLILIGGIAYTIGAILYSIGKKKKIKYMHSIFHLFVLLGTLLQFVAIYSYIL